MKSTLSTGCFFCYFINNFNLNVSTQINSLLFSIISDNFMFIQKALWFLGIY